MSLENVREGALSVRPLQAIPAAGQRCRHKILVVDDEPEVLSGLRGTLEPAGYVVECATSLAEGLNALGRHTFHLVLTDLYLGGTDLGYALAEKANDCSPRVPVVLLTGRPSFNGAQEALRSRVAEIVVKPTQPHDLLATCRRTIHEAELRRKTQALEVQNRVLASVLPRAIEVKDPTTSGHADRVVRYADALACRCGVSEEDREHLRMASLFHDVGKIGIPDQILTKPGPLTSDERVVIQRHPAMGYEILKPLDGTEKVRRWVYQHHERWDGRGYPEGLRGEDVELPGRILILAEVYDALAERRSYKEPWSTTKIAAFFRDQSGRHFDPQLSHMVADGVESQGSRFFAGGNGLLF